MSKSLLFGLNIHLAGVQLGLGIGFVIDFFFASEAVPYVLAIWIVTRLLQIYCNHKYGS